MEAKTEERRSVVASGKNVEDAIKTGLTMLGVRRDQVDVEVLSEGSRGVLGFGAENARVRLLVRTSPAPKPAEPPAPRTSPAPKPEPPAPRAAPAPQPEPAPIAVPPPSVREPEPKKTAAEEAGIQVLQELLGLMGFEATIEVTAGAELADEGQPPPPVLNITGEDLGSLIGRRGETLRALQYLLRLMVSHRVKHWTNLVVDVENYRLRRRRALESLAAREADEVIRTGRSRALEPMPSDERRVVHMALRNHPKVTTHSVGEGERRKVTIIPRR